jgi:hypothetical protein
MGWPKTILILRRKQVTYMGNVLKWP